LQEAVGQILSEFALAAPTIRVRAIFGASNELADQLLAGSPGDVFISADPGELNRLDAAKVLVRGSQRVVASNGLAIIGGFDERPIKKPTDLLDARIKTVVLAEPACPLGQYSKAYLQKARVYEKLLPKVVHVDNSRGVLTSVAAGAAQVGVAFASDAVSTGKWQLLMKVPTSQAAATYAAAIVRRKPASKNAQSLCDFLISPAAVRCFRRCGFASATTFKKGAGSHAPAPTKAKSRST
jgi:molybdate transport system substrate-binding protein